METRNRYCKKLINLGTPSSIQKEKIMIYFVRHGETDYNKKSIMQGHLDIPLNETGIMQAYKAKENLKDIKIDEIYCSPLQRAFKTAQIINENYNLEINPDSRIKEICGGEMQGKVLKNLPKETRDLYYNSPDAFGGETLPIFCERVTRFLKEKANSDKNILIVSHAGVYRAIYRYINNIESYDFELESPKNSEIIKIDI